MNIFDVFVKDDSIDLWVNAFSTTSSTPVEMGGYPFADYEYRLRQDDVSPNPQEPRPEWEWYIDKGPFYDRFGDAEGAILASSDPTVKAILASTAVREYIDLRNPKVVKSIRALQALIPAVTQELADYVLNTPVGLHENRSLRKKLFNGEGN